MHEVKEAAVPNNNRSISIKRGAKKLLVFGILNSNLFLCSFQKFINKNPARLANAACNFA
jgi:hypothetical protein